ncbi:MAG: ATP-grasp domain-containing protein [Ferruginibacter sp.]|nr:ATP-grasp domain-containing protein [Ferruginibacter sp.]MBU9937665.1 ATP-grasp domain-containing protein [Ferruginibacter sp.]
MMDIHEAGTINGKLLFNDHSVGHPAPGSAEELLQFKKLQEGFTNQFELFFPDNFASKSIVVIPSLTLDQEVLAKVQGALHYEERLLCLLMLLRMPRAHVIYVSSTPIDPVIIDYYLHLLPGITGYHARERLTLLSCYDSSQLPLTQKILNRPRLIERIRNSIPAGHVAHIACFNTTAYERTLAVRLGLPIYGCDPSLVYLGTKSGSRRVFMKVAVPVPPGAENLQSYDDIVHAVAGLKDMYPKLKKAVIKLNDGFSGDGNAVLEYPDHISKKEMFSWIHHNLLHEIKPVAAGLSVEMFLEKFRLMEGIVEAFLEGEVKTSPSVQCRINPLGEVDIISTHDQVLAGENEQVFVGAHFPASPQYRTEIAVLAKTIAKELQREGVLGRFSIDFVSVKQKDTWKHYAIEINIRKGGTTHPYLMLQFLTNGHYDEATGDFETPNKQKRYYFASDNLQRDSYKGLTPQDLIDIAMFHGLHYDGAAQKGVMFHMIGALSQYGKMGVVCIGETPEEAYSYYVKTFEVLDAETAVR